MLTPRRNTLSNGTRLSSPSWPSSTSALSTRTARTPRGPSTRTETLPSGLPTVWRLGRRRARPKLSRLCSSRGRRLRIHDETEGGGILGTATTDDTNSRALITFSLKHPGLLMAGWKAPLWDSGGILWIGGIGPFGFSKVWSFGVESSGWNRVREREERSYHTVVTDY